MALEELKHALCEAPALRMPDHRKSFALHVNEQKDYMTSVLTQEWGDQNKPVGYYSQQLDAVSQGWGPCLRAVQAVYLALQCATPVVLDQKITIRCPHSVHARLSLWRAARVTLPRWIKWSTALEMPNITIEKATPSNPATLLAPSETIPNSHDCVEIVQMLSVDEHLDNLPLQNPDLILYTDGSSFVDKGERRAGCSCRRKNSRNSYCSNMSSAWDALLTAERQSRDAGSNASRGQMGLD
ncbi:Gag-Pol polyprotein [Labeo rohita]|uniref:Gag-Pol polyprotein n=1 Tax=Labeo rohita TaxID=84645 RepID=A0ABQ8L5N7_LABRO|nr:Gag-Pol polyprotein [Labeo rohita]